MKSCLLDGGEWGEYNGVGFVEISKMFEMLVAFFFGMIMSDSLLGSLLMYYNHTPRSSVLELRSNKIFRYQSRV